MDTPERQLWASAALTALNDCLIPMNAEASASGEHSELRYRKEAERYFKYPSRDLYELCVLAGVNPRAFVKAGRDLLALPESEKARRRREDRII